MSKDSSIESTPVGVIVGKPENRGESRIKYHIERVGRILEEDPKQAAEKLGREIAELEEQREEDPATGLKTRPSGKRALKRQIEISREKDAQLSVVMFDLDGFKQVNDSQGHEAGNRAIQIMADFLENRTSRIDIACRYGGDEFFLIMPGSSISEAKGLATRIIDELPALMIQNGFNVTTSVGIAQCTEEDDSPESLLEKADRALLEAKEKGKNRVEVFEPKA